MKLERQRLSKVDGVKKKVRVCCRPGRADEICWVIQSWYTPEMFSAYDNMVSIRYLLDNISQRCLNALNGPQSMRGLQ